MRHESIDFIFRTSDPIDTTDYRQVAAARARKDIARTKAADYAAPNPDMREVMEFARWHAANPERRYFHWSALAYDLRRRFGDDGRAALDAGLEGYPPPGRPTYGDEIWSSALRHPDGERPHCYHPDPRPRYCDESLVTRIRAWQEHQAVRRRVEAIKARALAKSQFADDMKAGKIPGPVGIKEESTMSEASAAPAVLRNAATLLAKTFLPVHYVVPRYVVEGCTILAGRPKVGKSWFMLDIGLAVAAGGEVLGTKAEQGDVLYLALEDNERRLKSRITKILGPFVKGPERFTYATEWPRVDEGGLDKIRAWIKSVPLPRLIVVDVLTRVRSQQQGRQAQYDADYSAVAGLQAIASESRVAVVIVHHLRKSASDSGDAIDKISGTLGLSGAADSILILDRNGQGTALYARGRDIEEIESAVTFDKSRCRWQVLGAAAEVRRSDERKVILDSLRQSGAPMSPSEIALATGMLPGNVRRLLFKMVRDGDVTRRGSGYGLPENTGNTGNAVTPGQQIILPPPG